jgi:hypothetical protein
MPAYKNFTHLEGDILGIMVDSTQIKILNESSFFDDFGKGKSDTMFFNILKLALPEAGYKYTRFKKIYFLSYEKEGFLNQRTFRLSQNDTLFMKLPVDGKIFKTASIKPDFLLLFHNLKTNERYSGFFNPLYGTNSSRRELVINAKFVIWDNQQGKIISYGEAEGISTVFMEMSVDNWYSAIHNMMKYIFQNTLFKK